VRYPPGHLADAKGLARTLVGGAGLAEDPSLGGSSLTLVLGPGVQQHPGPDRHHAGQAQAAQHQAPAVDLREYDPGLLTVPVAER
jgi:hypothetical protein